MHQTRVEPEDTAPKDFDEEFVVYCDENEHETPPDGGCVEFQPDTRIDKTSLEEDHVNEIDVYHEIDIEESHSKCELQIQEEELDEEAASQAKLQAEEALKNEGNSINYAKARAELAETVAQIRTIQRLRKKAGR